MFHWVNLIGCSKFFQFWQLLVIKKVLYPRFRLKDEFDVVTLLADQHGPTGWLKCFRTSPRPNPKSLLSQLPIRSTGAKTSVKSEFFLHQRLDCTISFPIFAPRNGSMPNAFQRGKVKHHFWVIAVALSIFILNCQPTAAEQASQQVVDRRVIASSL